MPHVLLLALVFGGGGPERRGHLGLADPVGAPGAGPRLDYMSGTWPSLYFLYSPAFSLSPRMTSPTATEVI